MSTQYLQFSSAPAQTCTPKLFVLGGDAVLFTGSSIADSPSGSGLYKSTFSESTAINGSYRCVIFVGAVGVAGYEVKFTGTDAEVAQGAEFTNAATSASTVTVILPASGTVPPRSLGETITVYNQEQITVAVAVFDSAGTPVDLSGQTLWFGVWDQGRTIITTAAPTGTATGFTVEIPKQEQRGRGNVWVVRNTTAAANEVILGGPFEIINRPVEA